MEYKELSVVICTEKNESQCKDIAQDIFNKAGCPVHIFLCNNSENKVGLSRVYQQMLDDEKINKNVILYMHDDVDVWTVGFGQEILRLFAENEDYGIIGVAGSKTFDERAMWWTYPKKYGQVIHKEDESNRCWPTIFSLPIKNDLEEVVIVDGLFFAVDPSRLKSGFDVKMPGFDFYEACLCLNNAKEGCKVGVTMNINLCHHSMGKMRQGWYENREIMNHQLYGKYYPIDIDEGFIEKNEDVEGYLKVQYEKITKEAEEQKKIEELKQKQMTVNATENIVTEDIKNEEVKKEEKSTPKKEKKEVNKKDKKK